MTVTVALTLLGYRIAVCHIRLDLDEPPSPDTPKKLADRAVKRMSRRWTRAMTS